MRIVMSSDRTDIEYINGKYSVDKSFSINMTKDTYQGIVYTLKVTTLNANVLEGEFVVWGQEQRAYETASDGVTTGYNPRRFTIRMKRTEK